MDQSPSSTSTPTNTKPIRATFEVSEPEHRFLRRAADRSGYRGQERSYYRYAALRQAAVEGLPHPIKGVTIGIHSPVVALSHTRVEAVDHEQSGLRIGESTISRSDAPMLLAILQHYVIDGAMPPANRIMKIAAGSA